MPTSAHALCEGLPHLSGPVTEARRGQGVVRALAKPVAGVILHLATAVGLVHGRRDVGRVLLAGLLAADGGTLLALHAARGMTCSDNR